MHRHPFASGFSLRAMLRAVSGGEANEAESWGIRLGLASGGCAYRNFGGYIWGGLGAEEAEE
jgi:hypothetical protein